MIIRRTSDCKTRLQIALDAKGIKAVELARRLNISRSTVSQWLSGKTSPKRDRLVEIANCLEVNPAWLMGLDVPMPIIRDSDEGIFDENTTICLNSDETWILDELNSSSVKFSGCMIEPESKTISKPPKRIATFDAMPPQLQKMISHEIITPEEKVAKTSLEHELLLKYRELNDEGQDKLLNYADDLISSNKYIKNCESEGMEESS